MKKICTKCKDEKLETEFNFRNKTLGIRNNCCRRCTKDYYSNFYQNNKDKEKARAYTNTILIRERNTLFVHNYLEKNPCIDCGESDIIVLEFDHIKGLKRKAVTTMAWDCYSIDEIIKEIEKCEVRCANCHRRKTAKQFGQQKYIRSVSSDG